MLVQNKISSRTIIKYIQSEHKIKIGLLLIIKCLKQNKIDKLMQVWVKLLYDAEAQDYIHFNINLNILPETFLNIGTVNEE